MILIKLKKILKLIINNALQASQNLMAEKEKEKNKVVPQQNIANNNANNANNA